MKSKKGMSYSAWSKYLLCPQMYNIYYNEELEPVETTSSLLFGSAIDEALNEMYLNDKDPVKVFKENFKYENMQNVVFHKKDLNASLFTESQLKKLDGESDHYKAWASLRVRGRVLLEHYMRVIYPLIDEVKAVQAPLSSGRSGYVDLIASFKEEPGVFYIIDHKASYYYYSDDSAKHSAQLSLYAVEEKIQNVAYIVLIKDIYSKKLKTCKKCKHVQKGGSHKTCNNETDGERCHGDWKFDLDYRPNIQVIKGKPSAKMKKTMKESVKIVEDMAKDGPYPRNYSTCDFVYGRKCEYYDYCYNGKKQGLKKKERK